MNHTDVIASLVLSGYALGRIAAQDAGNDAPAAQWRVLSLLEQEGARRVGELAAAARTTQPGMTRLLGLLEREGLVLRSPDPDDSRATVVDITPQGTAARRGLARGVPRDPRAAVRRPERRRLVRSHPRGGDPRRAQPPRNEQENLGEHHRTPLGVETAGAGLGRRLRLRRRLHGIGLVDPILPRDRGVASGVTGGDRTALHQLPAGDRPRDAGDQLDLQPHRRQGNAAHRARTHRCLRTLVCSERQRPTPVIGFRAGWGLGNALFISTALATIVGSAFGRQQRRRSSCTRLALGLGIAVGPLLGGILGEQSWRGPFFGVVALMAIAFVAVLVLLRGPGEKRVPVPFSAPFTAPPSPPRSPSSAVAALFYNIGFFVLLAFSRSPWASAR